jgi:hypothetical protein
VTAAGRVRDRPGQQVDVEPDVPAAQVGHWSPRSFGSAPLLLLQTE